MNTSTLNTISPIISLPSNSSIFPITCTHPTPLCQHVYLPKGKREQESEKKDNRHHLPFLCCLYAKSIRMRPQCSFYAFPRCYVRLELKWEARQFIIVGSISPIIKQTTHYLTYAQRRKRQPLNCEDGNHKPIQPFHFAYHMHFQPMYPNNSTIRSTLETTTHRPPTKSIQFRMSLISSFDCMHPMRPKPLLSPSTLPTPHPSKRV